MADSSPLATDVPERDAAGAATVLPPLWLDSLLVLLLGFLVLTPFPAPGRYLSGDPLHYAAIAKSTLAGGDWLALRLGDQPYFNKPPLMFWLAMNAFQLLGTSTFVAQFTGAIFGIAMLLATRAVACRLGDRRHGLLAAVVLCTTYVFVKNAAVLRLDAPAALCILGAIWAVWEGRRRPRLLALFWVLTAIAVGFKGVSGLFGVPVLIFWSLLRRDTHPWKSPWFWSTLLLLPLPVLPWVLHNLELHQQLFVSAWWHDNVEINLTGERSLPPLLKYGYDLAVEGWPWLPFLLHGAWLNARALWRGSRDDRWTLPAAWILGVFLPLLCLSGAFSRYVLPLLPASCFLVATSLLTLWPRVVGRRLYLALGGLLLLLSLTAAFAGERLVKDRTPDVVRFYPWLAAHDQADRLYELDSQVSWHLQSASIFYLDRQVQPLLPAELSARLADGGPLAVLVRHADATHPAANLAADIHGERIIEGEKFDLVLFRRDAGAVRAPPGG